MLTFRGSKQHRYCDGLSRRDFLRVGALGLGGLTLADLFRLEAQGAVDARAGHKAIIMIYLGGAPATSTCMISNRMRPRRSAANSSRSRRPCLVSTSAN